MSEGKSIGQVLQSALADVAASPEQSTRVSGSSAHKRAFLETFRRWEILFKRKDAGDVQSAKWLIAEYYDSLKHLSVEGFDTLTKRLKETCIFFPSIKECLDATRPTDRYDWGHPFLNRPQLFCASPRGLAASPAPTQRLEDLTDNDQ